MLELASVEQFVVCRLPPNSARALATPGLVAAGSSLPGSADKGNVMMIMVSCVSGIACLSGGCFFAEPKLNIPLFNLRWSFTPRIGEAN